MIVVVIRGIGEVVPQLTHIHRRRKEKRPATHEAEKQWQKEIEMTKSTAWAKKQCASRINLTTEIEDDICSSSVVGCCYCLRWTMSTVAGPLDPQPNVFNRFIGCIKRSARFLLRGLCSQSLSFVHCLAQKINSGLISKQQFCQIFTKSKLETIWNSMPTELRVFFHCAMYDEEMFSFIVKKTLELTWQFERNTFPLRHTRFAARERKSSAHKR